MDLYPGTFLRSFVACRERVTTRNSDILPLYYYISCNDNVCTLAGAYATSARACRKLVCDGVPLSSKEMRAQDVRNMKNARLHSTQPARRSSCRRTSARMARKANRLRADTKFFFAHFVRTHEQAKRPNVRRRACNYEHQDVCRERRTPPKHVNEQKSFGKVNVTRVARRRLRALRTASNGEKIDECGLFARNEQYQRVRRVCVCVLQQHTHTTGMRKPLRSFHNSGCRTIRTQKRPRRTVGVMKVAMHNVGKRWGAMGWCRR